MKKIISILIFITFLGTSTQVVYADNETFTIDESMIDDFDPTKSDDGTLAETVLDQGAGLVNKVLGIIQIIGAILAVISIAYFGFQMIAGTNEQTMKALSIDTLLENKKDGPSDVYQIRQYMWRLLIGSILLFSGGTIVRIVYNLFMK